MARVRELMYWNMDNTARSEWANLVTSKTKDQQAQLARYAFNQNWWDLSVQATIAGKLWDQLEERFPLAYNDLFTRYISGKDIPQSYAMAIARQESAWNPKAGSPVGARGLMQIMPGTATHTVSMFSIPGYSGLFYGPERDAAERCGVEAALLISPSSGNIVFRDVARNP